MIRNVWERAQMPHNQTAHISFSFGNIWCLCMDSYILHHCRRRQKSELFDVEYEMIKALQKEASLCANANEAYTQFGSIAIEVDDTSAYPSKKSSFITNIPRLHASLAFTQSTPLTCGCGCMRACAFVRKYWHWSDKYQSAQCIQRDIHTRVHICTPFECN